MTKSYLKRWICFSIILAVVFGGTALFYGLRSARYERHIISQNESALSTLISSTEQMENGLSSLKYGSDGAALYTTAAQVYASSQSAKAALSSLPIPQNAALQYEKLINQAGEYALSVLVGTAGGKAVSKEQLQNVDSVNQALSALNAKVSLIKEGLDVGEIMCGGTVSAGKNPCIGSEFKKLQKDFPEYSSLVYDGGFSDHIGDIAPAFTKGKAEISIEDAKQMVAELLQTEPIRVSLHYDSNGTIPVYGFSASGTIVEVTKSGGMVLTLSVRRDVGAAEISESSARDIALQFAESLGYEGLACRYSSTSGNILTAELFPTSNGVVAYTDRVTVAVALDNGQVLSFDGRDYLMNNTLRELQLPGVIPAGASLALVPTDGMGEKLCFEYYEDGCLRFVCSESGQCYKVHVWNGDEARGFLGSAD